MNLQLGGPLVLVGAGKMGSALLEGWLARGLDPQKVVVQDPAPPVEVAEHLAAAGIPVAASIGPLSEAPDVIVVAVKPQAVDAVMPPLSRHVGPQTLVLSIAAGRTIAGYERYLPSGTAVVRAMPNTPASVGRGITISTANAHVTAGQRALCDALLSAVGEVGWVDDEGLMDAVTAVSGSGPAYVFLLAECLAEAGKTAGLDEALATRLARATVAGAGELLHRSRLDASVLRENVTSPGGTTAAALGVLMAPEGLRELITRAVAAALSRGRELAR